MILELGTVGKYKILDHPVALPNKCVGCGIGHNDGGRVKFVDTGHELEFYGVIYLCSNCFNEVAESLGYISSDKWTNLKLCAEEFVHENDLVKAENDGLRDAVHILTGHKCHSVFDGPFSVELKEDPTYEDPASGITTGRESAKSEPDASSSESGLSDVRGASKPKPKSEPTAKPINDPISDFEL